jgi:hypothetical protein
MEIIWGRFVEKTEGQKSRATVPLIIIITSVFAYKKAKLGQKLRNIPLFVFHLSWRSNLPEPLVGGADAVHG